MQSPTNPSDAEFWASRYAQEQTGWDIGYPSTPLKTYIDQLTDKATRVLIPGAGNAYEAEYLWRQGFRNVQVLDIASAPLEALAERIPDLPAENLIHGDFFTHQGEYDLILEQTFFCSFFPSVENRRAYARKMKELLAPKGKLVGLLFSFPLDPARGRPPYGGSEAEYRKHFSPDLEVIKMERAYNSIPARMGNELFFMAERR